MLPRGFVRFRLDDVYAVAPVHLLLTEYHHESGEVKENRDSVLLQIMDHVMAGVEDILGKHGNYHVRDKYACTVNNN